MASKQKQAAATFESSEYPRKVVQCEDGKTAAERGRKYAALMTSPELAAFRVINGTEQNFDLEKHIDVPTLMEILREQGKAVNRSDLAQAEAMLINQATALQSLFARLTEKAFSVADLPQFDSFMRVALRAQNQCRATLETLSAIKHPPVIIAKQANIAHGPQQVNNETVIPMENSRPGKTKFEQNELLTEEVGDGTTLDTRTTGTAIRANQAMEAVGTINGTASSEGEGNFLR